MEARITEDARNRKNCRECVRGGPIRFNDLARMISGASRKTISERLRSLEAQGLVRRDVLRARPLSLSYGLTTRGERALGVLDELRQWSEALPPEPNGAPRQSGR